MDDELDVEWELIAGEAIAAAENVDCTPEELIAGLQRIETLIRARWEMG